MEWLGEIGGALLTAGSGGIFGVVGAVIGGVSKHFAEKSRRAWELQKNEMKIAEMKMKMEMISQGGSWDGLTASMMNEAPIQSSDVHTWVNDVRSLFRPVLTVLLWGLAFAMFYMIINGVFSDYLEATETKELVRYMVYSIFFSASTAGAWWFADRALMPPNMKAR